jgi:hypothetical protein
MGFDLIPAVDAAGLPAPAWLFHFFLVFTFFLHLLFMNLTLGGTLLAAVAHSLNRGRGDGRLGVMASRLVAMNSYGISLTITTGVAPLLFIQTLYQQYFYSGTILIGSMWFALVIFLIVGYYAAYLYKFKGAPTTGRGGGVWIWSAALLFLLIASIHVAVHLIHVQPQGWIGYAANGWSVISDPTFFPRLLHFVLAGVGYSALVVAWWAVRQANRGEATELNTAIAETSWRWALWTTALVVVDGVVLLLLLPRPVLSGFMQGGAAVHLPFTVGLLGAIGLVFMLARARDPVASTSTVTGTLAATVFVVLVMTVTRHQIRLLYLEPTAQLQTFTVAAQWFNFVLFVVLLVASLATVAYMVHRVLTSPAQGEDAA